jgi:hypothetical protein
VEELGVASIDLTDVRLQGPSGLVGDYFSTDDYYDRVKNARLRRNFTEQEGRHLVFFTHFPTRENQQVLTKTRISYVSMEGARGNLNQDIPDWNFERVRRKAWFLWNKALSCITIEGATKTQRTIFNTALYHTMIDPRDVRDVGGKYMGADKKIHSSTTEEDFDRVRLLSRSASCGAPDGKDRLQTRHPHGFGFVCGRSVVIRARVGRRNLCVLPRRAVCHGLRPGFS